MLPGANLSCLSSPSTDAPAARGAIAQANAALISCAAMSARGSTREVRYGLPQQLGGGSLAFGLCSLVLVESEKKVRPPRGSGPAGGGFGAGTPAQCSRCAPTREGCETARRAAFPALPAGIPAESRTFTRDGPTPPR